MIGANFRDIRVEHRVTQEQATDAARSFGSNWTRAIMTRLEKGSLAISVESLLTLVLVLRETTGVAYGPADLLGGHEIKLNKVTTLDPIEDFNDLHGTRDLSKVPKPLHGHATVHAARKLGVSKEEFEDAARYLWGRSLDEERDSMLEDRDDPTPGQIRYRRQQATIVLTAQIEAHLKGSKP